MNKAATETSEEIRNSAECTAFRAITVKSPARIAAIENIQKKTDSQPERIMIFGLWASSKIIFHLSFDISHLSFDYATLPRTRGRVVQIENEKCQMTNGK